MSKESDFWTHDFNTICYNEKIKPVMPRLSKEEGNWENVNKAIEALKILSDFMSGILKQRFFMFWEMLICYSE